MIYDVKAFFFCFNFQHKVLYKKSTKMTGILDQGGWDFDVAA